MSLEKRSELKKLAFSGIKWQVAANTANRIVSLGGMLVLARFLGPSVFGLFALTLSVVNAFELFKSLGLDTALIRRKEQFELAADTAFFIIPLLGLTLYSGLFITAPVLGRMFHAPELGITMRILGIAFICNCFTRVPSAILERRMEFKKLSIAEMLSSFLFTLVAVPMAFLGAGIWSLVTAYLTRMSVYMVLVWMYAGWRPAFRFSSRIAVEMFSFGKFIFLSSVVFFLRMNVDNMLVGKYLGVTLLGLYALAFNIANFTADHLGIKVHRVSYSAYSRLERDEDLAAAFLKTLKYLSLIALPIGTGIMLFGDQFIGLVYGSKWTAAGSALKILALAGIFNTLPVGVMPALLAKGKSFLSFLITGGQVLVFLIFIVPVAKLSGIEGVAVVVSCASFAGLCASFFFLTRLLKVKPGQIMRSVRPAFVSSVSMAAVAIALSAALTPYRSVLSVYGVLALVAICSMAMYGVILLKMERSLLKEIKEVVV